MYATPFDWWEIPDEGDPHQLPLFDLDQVKS
jgi:hypothetical protein